MPGVNAESYTNFDVLVKQAQAAERGKLHLLFLPDGPGAGAADGFWILPDVNADGIDAFANEVVPILQERGLFQQDYKGNTLRKKLGLQDQYGIDPRIAKNTKQEITK